ncbi:hypothetical protein HG530_003892 [Fusarium avenaceum]|nr:hypothetical protein HG530_003892 [Fusarium avenaceum]
MQVPSLDPDLVPLLMFICLILVCILCLSCLILVIVVIRLCVHTQQSPPVKVEEKKEIKKEFKEDVKETVKKTIKKLSEPAQELLHSAQDHLKHPKQPQQQQQRFTQQSIDSFCHPSSTMSSSHTQHLVAVATPEANTILFQVDQDFNLCFYESSTPDETENEKYDFKSLKVDGGVIKVNSKLPVVAAVAFSLQFYCNGEAQVRVYYVSRDGNFLRELQRAGGVKGKWKHGEKFNNKNYRIAENSGLTANVFQVSKENFAVKVYYQESNEDIYADVVYNIVGSNEWSTRPNVTQA